MLSGNFALDTIVVRDYPEGFTVGKNNRFTETVVDWEGAGDWTTSQLIACLCEKDCLSVEAMTSELVRGCLQKASETASRSVSFMSSKGMIDVGK